MAVGDIPYVTGELLDSDGKIKASKSNYNKIIKKIKNSGVPKTVKFKRI